MGVLLVILLVVGLAVLFINLGLFLAKVFFVGLALVLLLAVAGGLFAVARR